MTHVPHSVPRDLPTAWSIGPEIQANDRIEAVRLAIALKHLREKTEQVTRKLRDQHFSSVIHELRLDANSAANRRVVQD